MGIMFTTLHESPIMYTDESFEEIPVNREVYPVGERFDMKFNGFFYLYPKPENVIFHDPATVVYWTDGSKTVVKCGPHDTFDPEKGLAMAIAKKFFGNGNEFHKTFKRWVTDES